MAPSDNLRVLRFLWTVQGLLILVSTAQCYNFSEPSASNETTHPYATHSPSSSISTFHPSDTTSIAMLNGSVVANLEEQMGDTGILAGIVVGVLGSVALVLTLVGYYAYNQCMKRTVTSLNFDNPVYRKTTEDQFSLEKNQYHPAGSYPPSLEPLTSPGTNEFV